MARPAFDTEVARTIADRVRSARETRGISQTELASRLGVDKSAIAHIEAARKSPSVQRIVALAGELRVTTDYLLGVA